MEISVREKNGVKIFDLLGDAKDLASTREIQARVEQAIETKDTNIAVNVSKTDYINSGIIGLFVHWQQLLKKQGKKFFLIEPGGYAKEVLTMVGFNKIIEIFDSEDQLFEKER